MWWQYLLGIGVFAYVFVSHYKHTNKKQKKIDRIKGCTCEKTFWNEINHNCPVHSPFYTRHYKTLDGKESTDNIYASGGTREPICEKCLNEILPRGYIHTWPFEIEERFCHTCGRMKQIRMMPGRDLILWSKNVE